MRAKLVLVTVLTLLVAGGATVNAAPLARYAGYGGPVAALGCTSMTIGGSADAGLGDIDEAAYQDCSYGGFFNLVVTPRLPWRMSTTIDDIEVAISGPFCEGTVTGSADTTYDSVTGVLTVVSQSTTVSYIDPDNDCLGLINEGEHLSVLPDSYDVVAA